MLVSFFQSLFIVFVFLIDGVQYMYFFSRLLSFRIHQSFIGAIIFLLTVNTCTCTKGVLRIVQVIVLYQRNTHHLLTESEVITGKSQTEALMY